MTEEISALHAHDIIDDDPHFSIDSYTREITFTSEQPPILVENDHNSERFTFEIPKTVDGHDMTLCDVVEVHYINIDASTINHEKPTTSSSKYAVPIDEIKPKADDPDTLTFTWLIDGLATRYIGPLNFAVRFRCTAEVEETTTDEEGKSVTVIKTVDTYRFNTKPYIGVCVSEGMDVQLAMSDAYVDIVDQWQRAIDIYGESSETKIRQVYSEAVTEINNTVTAAKTSAKTEIDDHVAEVVEETRKELAASALDAKDILVQTTGQATDKVMSQKATTDALNANFNNLSAADAVLENTLRSEIAILNRNVVDLLSNDELKRYVLLHRGEPTVDAGEAVPPEPYTAAEGIKYAVYSEASNADDGHGYFFRASAVVEYCPYSSYGDPTSTPIRRKSIAIESELCVVSNQYLPSSEPTTWVRQEDDTLYIKLPEYDKYGNGVLTMRFLDCYVTYAKDDSGLIPGAGLQLNVVYELDGERKTLVVPVCESSGFYLEYTYTPTGVVIPSLPKLIECKYEIDTTRVAVYEVYRVNEFLDGNTVSYTVNANNIASIKRTKTEGLVDTYTVMFDDGKTTTFTVTNGRAIASVDKTDTINDEDIYTVYFNDGTTMTFTVPNVEANRSYLEDNVEDLRMILEEFGATTNETFSDMAGVIDVPERVSKYARLNSFGGMSRKVAVPSAQGYNLLPFPYADGNLGADGAGTLEFTGLIADVSGAEFIGPSNPWTVPNTAEGAWYKFKVWTDCPHPHMNIEYQTSDGKSVTISGNPSTNPDIVASTDGSSYEIVLYLEPGTTVKYFTYSCDFGGDTSHWTCSGGIYRGSYISSDLDPDDPNSYEFHDEWVPRVASYKFYNTKLRAIKSVGANLIPFPYVNDVSTYNVGDKYVKNGITYTIGERGKITVNGTASADSSFATVTISNSFGSMKTALSLTGCPVGGSPTTYYLSIGGYRGHTWVNGVTDFGSGVVYNNSLDDVTGAMVSIGVKSGVTVNNVEFYPCLTIGDVPLSAFVPYTEPNIYTIPSDIPAVDGFEDVVGIEHTDSIDISSRTHNRKIGVIKCDGTETWDYYRSPPDGVFVPALVISDKKPGPANLATTIGTYKNMSWDHGSHGNFCGHSVNNSVYFVTSECTTLDQWKIHLAALAAQGTPLTVYYELATPTEEPLPTRLDKLIPIESNGHLIAVTDTGEEVPIDVEFTVLNDIPTVNNVYTKSEVDAMIAELSAKLTIVAAKVEEV